MVRIKSKSADFYRRPIRPIFGSKVTKQSYRSFRAPYYRRKIKVISDRVWFKLGSWIIKYPDCIIDGNTKSRYNL